MRVLVPFDARDSKTRLSPVLDSEERQAFATAMLRDVLDQFDGSDHDPELLATADIECQVPVTVDDQPLTEAVNSVLEDAEEPIAIVMADLALLTPGGLERLFGPDEDVVIAPGIGGGTNALVIRHPEFRVDYHGVSVRDHREIADSCGASLATVDSFRLAVDIDDPQDFTEVLLHTDGRSASWLRTAGFDLSTADGRVTATR